MIACKSFCILFFKRSCVAITYMLRAHGLIISRKARMVSTMSYMKVIIQGNVGRAPRFNEVPDRDGNMIPVTNFSVAVNDPFQKKGQPANPWWLEVSVWRAQAAAVHEYLKKGQPVLVDGVLKHVGGNPRLYVNKAGETRSNFELIADSVRFINGGGGVEFNGGDPTSEDIPGAERGAGSEGIEPGSGSAQEEDEIPF